MKKGIQFAILGTLFTAAVLLLTPSVESVYQPRIQNEQGAAGAAAYLHELRANQVTGDVSQADIQASQVSLPDFINLIKDVKGVGTHIFTEKDIVRAKILQEVVVRYDKWKIQNNIK